MTVHDVVAVVQVSPEPSDTVYPVTEDPSPLAAVQLTSADWSPAVAVALVGASGIVVGVTLLEASEAEPSPLALVATTVKV